MFDSGRMNASPAVVADVADGTCQQGSRAANVIEMEEGYVIPRSCESRRSVPVPFPSPPRSVRGISVRPVCLLDSDHAVSP